MNIAANTLIRSIRRLLAAVALVFLAGCGAPGVRSAEIAVTAVPTREPSPVVDGERVATVYLCQEAVGKTSDQVRQSLLIAAQKRALQQLYGEAVSAVTTFENFQVVQDRIEAVSPSQVLILVGDPIYENSKSGVGDVCISATFAVDEQAYQAALPVRIESRRVCKARSDAGVVDIIEFTIESAKLAALYDYEPRLQALPSGDILDLFAATQYEENDFAGAETYCVQLSGVVIPDELRSSLDGRAPELIDGATPPAAPASVAVIDRSPSASTQPTVAASSTAFVENLCVALTDFDKQYDAEKHLLYQAENLAIDMIYGVTIEAESITENFELLRDQVRRLAAGKVRPATTPDYNLKDDGRVCIAVSYVATQEDIALFAPERIEGEAYRDAAAAGELDLRRFTMDQAELEALRNSDRRLRCVPDAELLTLLRNVQYVADGELPKTNTYHIKFVGYLIPAEVETLVSEYSDCQTLATLPADTPTQQDSATSTETPRQTDTPFPTPTDTPLPIPTDTPSPIATSTPTPLAPLTIVSVSPPNPIPTGALITIRGTGPAAALIGVISNDAPLGTTFTDLSGAWEFDIQFSEPGDYKIATRMYLADGTVRPGSGDVIIHIATPTPTPTPSPTPAPTDTPLPTATNTPRPAPMNTNTPTSVPAVVLPPPTSTPWLPVVRPTPTPTPSPTPLPAAAGRLTLRSPGNGDSLSGTREFQWEYSSGITGNQQYELVFWPAINGAEPAGWCAPRGPLPNTTVAVDLDAFAEQHAACLKPGESYFWGVYLVYADNSRTYLGGGWTFTYQRSGGGEPNPSNGGQPGGPDPLPPGVP